jgi:hypothetical protein
MLRSLKVFGVVALTVGVPSLAIAGTDLPPSGSKGNAGYNTSVTVDAAPLNSKCPAVLKIHGTTTLLNPDGKHFSATAFFKLGSQVSNTVTLDFSKHTTVNWEADWHDPQTGQMFQSGIVVAISDYTGNTSQDVVANQGTFQVGCGMATAGSKPSIPAPDTLTKNTCDDYVQANLSVTSSTVMWTGLGIASSMSHSMYAGKKKADVDEVFDVIKHFKSMCSIPATRFYWFDGEGAKNTPNWGKCNSYDNSVVTVSNDATGWLVKAGENVIFRTPLEADARTLGNAVKHRSYTCEIGEGSEPSENVLHYLR